MVDGSGRTKNGHESNTLSFVIAECVALGAHQYILYRVWNMLILFSLSHRKVHPKLLDQVPSQVVLENTFFFPSFFGHFFQIS